MNCEQELTATWNDMFKKKGPVKPVLIRAGQEFWDCYQKDMKPPTSNTLQWASGRIILDTTLPPNTFVMELLKE